MQNLTARQIEVLSFMYRRELATWPASLREISWAIGTKAATGAHWNIGALQRKGFVSREEWGSTRTRHVTAIPVFSGDPARIVDFIPRGAA